MSDIESGDYAKNPLMTEKEKEVLVNHADIYKKNETNKELIPLGIEKMTEVINYVYFYVVETYNDMIS